MENKHQKIKNIIKIIGIILFVCALVLTICGFINFFNAINNSQFPNLFYLAIIGLPLLGISIGLLSFAFRKEIISYSKNEAMPVLKEAGEDIAPTVANIALKVKQNLNAENAFNNFEKDNTTQNKEDISKKNYCSNCGKAIQDNDKFCPFCGKKLK